MEQDGKEKASADSTYTDWMKSVSDFWLSAATWPGIFKAPGSPQSPSSESAGRMQDRWQSLLKTWQTSASALSSPQTLESVLKGAKTIPEAALKILNTTSHGYFQLYAMWMKNIGQLGEAGKAYSYEGVEPDTFKEWTAFYEKEIQPILKVPQIGMTRFYQERASEALDKFNQAQVAIGEFLHMFGLSVEKSVLVMQEKLEEQAKQGKVSENFKDYYNMWIKILEGHCMTLYQSPEYAHCMGKTVKFMDEFKGAQETVMEDMLQCLPVPTNKDMDELYKEFYLLKKTVKETVKRVKKLESLP